MSDSVVDGMDGRVMTHMSASAPSNLSGPSAVRTDSEKGTAEDTYIGAAQDKSEGQRYENELRLRTSTVENWVLGAILLARWCS